MSDIRTTWNPGPGAASGPGTASELSAGDWLIDPPSFDASADLETAVLISLFSDARAAADDILPIVQDDRRGWWADQSRRGPIGSRLWLLSREKATNETRLRAQEYCRAALAWMLTDAVADRVTVDASWAAAPAEPGQLEVEVAIYRGGNVMFSRRYDWVWAQERGRAV